MQVYTGRIREFRGLHYIPAVDSAWKTVEAFMSKYQIIEACRRFDIHSFIHSYSARTNYISLRTTTEVFWAHIDCLYEIYSWWAARG